MTRSDNMFNQQLIILALLALCCNLINAQLDCQYSADAAPPKPGIRSNLYHGQQAFSVDMLAAIQDATPNENIFFSPYSTYHALLLSYFGATGKTEAELVKSLRLDWASGKKDVQRGYRVEKQTRAVRALNMPLLEFSSADRIYVDQRIQLTDCLTSSFMDELESVDFEIKSEEVRMSINNWISNVTQGQIVNMLNAGDITADSRLVLANAAYFKGQWKHQFNEDETKKEIFYTSVNESSFVDMMHTQGTYNFNIDETLGAHILQMPYLITDKNDTDSEYEEPEISMIVILPPQVNNGLENVLKKLNPETLENAIKESSPRDIEVSMPKFEFEQRVELVPILRKIGINAIFERSAEFGDFSKTENISFGDAKHVAKIKVDEQGSTAAAATAFFSFRSARPLEPYKFECNHPFLFTIYDQTAKAVLFTGIYRKT